MSTRPNLLEFLSETLPVGPAQSSTEFTENDSDEYDAPQERGLGIPDSVYEAHVETEFTRRDEETYDNDIGIDALNLPGAWIETERTAFARETYDNDVDATSLGIPDCDSEWTSFTKTAGETSDDDMSAEGLTFPAS